MGLTLLALIIAVVLVGMGIAILRTGRSSGGAVWASLSLLFLAGFCAFTALVEPFTPDERYEVLPVTLSRLATGSVALSSAFLFGSALLFLARRRLWPTVAAFATLALSAWIAVVVNTTPLHMIAVIRTVGLYGGIHRMQGELYALLNVGVAAPAILAVLLQGGRMVLSKERIHRQRAAIFFSVSGLGLVSLYLFVSVKTGLQPSYYLTPYAAFAIGFGVYSSYRQSRLFDWRSIGQNLLVYAALTLLYGGFAGLVTATSLVIFRNRSLVAVPVFSALAFAAAFMLGRSFRDRLFARVGGRGEYREALESALAHVDLSAGRDAVIEELRGVLASSFDFSDFGILVEDDRGNLRPVFQTPGVSATCERGSPMAQALENCGEQVLLKTEIEGQPSGELYQAGILELFASLRAEAIVLAREGRRVVGLFSFGARRSGADYTDYDYESFRAIYGKLFVFAYYFKNVARESILYTVNRELALSDQVIRFALEKVDRIEHPAADAAWICRSTRTLGGDFVDFVRLSRDRWFFVMGDVSGKGLSASMNMLVLKSMIRTFLRFERDFSGLVQRVNSFIKDYLPRGTFFAGVFGYFDFSSSSVYFINCGIPAMLLYSPNFDAFVEVQGEGKVLGFVRDVTPWIKPRKLALPPGSALAVTTDGILESENLRGERFGKDRLRRSTRERLDKAATEISDGVFADLLSFTDRRQEDDITLFVLKMLPRSGK